MSPCRVKVAIGDRGVATVSFADDAVHNAWSPALEADYYAALGELDQDPEVRAIVVTGAGRHFCPGAAPETLEALVAGEFRVSERLSPTHLLRLDTPLIAAVNGGCAGMGLVQALLCDVRFVSPSTTFSTAFAQRGLAGEYGVTWLLPRLIGLPDAMDLLLTARKVRGPEAHELRLGTFLVEDDELLAAACAYAQSLADNSSPVSLAFIRHQLWADLDRSLGEALPVTWRSMEAAVATGHVAEGVASLQERRQARFPALPQDMNVRSVTEHHIPEWPHPIPHPQESS